MERSDGLWCIGFSGDGATTLSGIKLPLQGPGLAWNVQKLQVEIGEGRCALRERVSVRIWDRIGAMAARRVGSFLQS